MRAVYGDTVTFAHNLVLGRGCGVIGLVRVVRSKPLFPNPQKVGFFVRLTTIR